VRPTAARERVLDLIFMGTPPFAATVLEKLIAAGHRICAVYTQPPRPAGRGHRLQPSVVQSLAEAHGLTLRCPARLRDEAVQAEFLAFGAEAVVVAAYGLILPRPILSAPRFGCLNVHASLLPRWRGAAPIQHAVLAGDADTGITIMQMEEGLDIGPILLQQRVLIGPNTTAAELTERLARLGGDLILAALEKAEHGRLIPRPQPSEGVTYAPKIGREEGRLDWRRTAVELERRVRALDLGPGAFFEHRGQPIRVIAAAALPETSDQPPGTVLDDRLSIACREGTFRPLRLQRPGRAPLDSAAFLRGYQIAAGTLLPCPVTS
jgi:methionyl-tRNA formyltransferase